MTKFKPLPSQAELHELFDYSVVTGELYWKVKPAHRVKVGSVAGWRHKPSNRFHVTIKSQVYKLHRVIWVWVTGEDPGALEVDHINGMQDCNSFHNLRLATRTQNNRNTRTTKGYTKRGNKYIAQITVNKKNSYLGTYGTEAEARAAYEKASRDLHGEFSSVR